MTIPDWADKQDGPFKYISAPKPADKEGGLWVSGVRYECEHGPQNGRIWGRQEGCSIGKAIQKQVWRFVKCGDGYNGTVKCGGTVPLLF